jgi:xylitol oxidase
VLRNWAGNVCFGAAALATPGSLEELQELVASSSAVRAIGTGHSFSDVADTTGTLVSLSSMPPVLEIDADRRRVRVSAATTYATLGSALDAAGWALPNLASLPHLSVAGACATGTHGSGDTNRSLAAEVTGLRLVRADGELVEATTADELAAAILSCGALGIVTDLELGLVPGFTVRQTVYDDLDFDTALGRLDDLFALAYSVSLFVDWRRPSVSELWLKERIEPGSAPPAAEVLGARAADGPRHPIRTLPPDTCTEQLSAPGPWYDRLPHFRADSPPSAAGEELQSELFVGRVRAADALEALRPLSRVLAPLVQVSELRSVAADPLWLSPTAGVPSVGIHFTWVHDVAAVLPVLEQVEDALEPFGARPHWGKLFVTPPDVLRERYERLADFGRLAARHDPERKFAGPFAERYLLDPA